MASPGLQELTVMCRQCGSADMARLDRREYKCRHCGALTLISDNDAERLEQLLRSFVAKQTAGPARGRLTARWLAVSVLLLVAGVLLATVLTRHRAAGASSASAVDDYFAQQSVPAKDVVMSPLFWQPGANGGGTYSGVITNHSGYAIMPPSYTLNLFKDGTKGESASSLALLSTLEPGEYEPVVFHYDGNRMGQRYEVEEPEHILHSSFEVAPVPLERQQLIYDGSSHSYRLTGVVRNTLRRPIQGSGELMLYGPDGRIVASGVGSLRKLMPGEQAVVTLNAFLNGNTASVVAYEYLLDTWYENQSQTVTLEQFQQSGKQTVPSRIVRVNHPRIGVVAAGAGENQ